MADLTEGYNKAASRIKAVQSYKDAKDQYNNAKKTAGDSIEKQKAKVSGQLDKLSGNVDKKLNKATNALNGVQSKIENYQKQLKTQLDHLLDLSNTVGAGKEGKGSGSQTKYIKRLFITAIKNIEPKIKQIVIDECIHAIGCDRQQTYTPGTVYIKVQSVDILSILKKDPTSKSGSLSYEKVIDIATQNQSAPYSMNRQLFERIQTGVSYSQSYGKNYVGQSGQDLFDVQYVETNPQNGENGGWYKVDLLSRNNQKVGEFIGDYYKTIKLVETQNIMSGIMDSLCGAVSIKASAGVGQVEDQTRAEIIIQRILGLCFENKSEIDVSGIAKLSEQNGPLDDSFFEFTEIDLRNIDLRVSNIQNGVTEFVECDNIKLPVNADAIVNDLANLVHVSDNNLVQACDDLTKTLASNPDWGLGVQANAQVAVDTNFIKLIAQGIVGAVITPKVLLPIYAMLKSLGNDAIDKIDSFMAFLKNFRTFAKNVVSKIGALFIKELFNLIKKDILLLIQDVLVDLVKEKAKKRLSMILKLIALILIVAQLIQDWRECKSVLDEILALLDLITSGLPGFGNDIPLPLLFASQMLDGYSETRAFIGAVEEMQSAGIPTGTMPSGAPNLELLSKFGQMKSMASEDNDNNQIQLAVGALKMTPVGVTIPDRAYGKKL
jgi:hypothetical protein